ncbi:MAG TPA: dipeptidase [Planctomycetia bacterium]|nr:dipeptidase [Planctomycetia bacterium]
MKAIDDYLAKNHPRAVDELKELLRIPSVSADSRHKGDVRKACQYVADKIKDAGLKVEILETGGNPIVLGEWLGAPGAPTVLIYGHYDVQPPDPLELWETGPFEPTERNGNLYARGSTDDKGQMYLHVKALEAWMKTEGKLPVNVKILVEGEEEVGSAAIGEYLATPEAAKRLKCDVAVISDTSMFAPDIPAITYGLKGIAYFELFVQGPNRDLHSGSFGGSVQNPCNALGEILAAIKGPDGRIRIPGFYDDVVEPTPAERDAYRKLPFKDDEYRAELGVRDLFGEAGYTTIERKWVRPTFDVNGIWGGYQGEGAKTVLPAKGGAKFSFRLVPNQDPHKIAEALTKFIAEKAPPGITFELKAHHGAGAVVVPLESPYMAAATKALDVAFGKEPVFIREGGSIPIVSDFKKRLGVDTILLGFGLPDDNPHSPNEKFRLKDYERGIRASAHLLKELAAIRV